MREYEIIDTNAENIGGCGFCGYKPGRSDGHHRKSKWLKERYAEGLRFKVLRLRESVRSTRGNTAPVSGGKAKNQKTTEGLPL